MAMKELRTGLIAIALDIHKSLKSIDEYNNYVMSDIYPMLREKEKELVDKGIDIDDQVAIIEDLFSKE